MIVNEFGIVIGSTGLFDKLDTDDDAIEHMKMKEKICLKCFQHCFDNKINKKLKGNTES